MADKRLTLSAALDVAAQRPGPRCAISRLLDQLAPDDAATLTAAIDDITVESSRIARALQMLDSSVRVSRSTIQRHRKRECSCDT